MSAQNPKANNNEGVVINGVLVKLPEFTGSTDSNNSDVKKTGKGAEGNVNLKKKPVPRDELDEDNEEKKSKFSKSSNEDDAENTAPKRKVPPPKAKKPEEDDDDEDSDDEENQPPPKSSKKKSSAIKSRDVESDSDDDLVPSKEKKSTKAISNKSNGKKISSKSQDDVKHVAPCFYFVHGHCNKDNCVFDHNPQLGPKKIPSESNERTEPCDFFQNNGLCANKNNCHYAHGRVQLRVICRAYMDAECKQTECMYYHPQKPKPCRFYSSGQHCAAGKECKFQHLKKKNNEKVADEDGSDEESSRDNRVVFKGNSFRGQNRGYHRGGRGMTPYRGGRGGRNSHPAQSSPFKNPKDNQVAKEQLAIHKLAQQKRELEEDLKKLGEKKKKKVSKKKAKVVSDDDETSDD